MRLLECFHQRCLRIILNIHWSDYVSNVEVPKQAEITSIEAILLYMRLLERFHQRCLRIILNIHWSDYVSNVEVPKQAEITSIEAILLYMRLLECFHQRCLRIILNIHWSDYVSNVEVLNRRRSPASRPYCYICDSWSVSISAVSVLFSTFTGATTSQMLRS